MSPAEPSPAEPRSAGPGAAQPAPRRRWSLVFLAVPVVLFVLAPFVANSIEPRVLGLPFMYAYIIVATIATWFFVWLTARFDRRYRADEAEFIPVDAAFHGVHDASEEEIR